MAHPPQEILIKVPCSDRLPENTGYYHAVIKESEDCIYFNHITEYWYHSKYEIVRMFPSHWYEPATRVVLTVEEYKAMELERIAFKDFIEWMFKYKYSEVQNVDIPIETIRFIHNRLGYANP